jgi:hypothetical protein
MAQLMAQAEELQCIRSGGTPADMNTQLTETDVPEPWFEVDTQWGPYSTRGLLVDCFEHMSCIVEA